MSDSIQEITPKQSSVISIMRGIAIFFVVMLHAKDFFLANIYAYNGTNDNLTFQFELLNVGASRVGIFFFISGFLLYKLRNRESNTKQYFTKRIARLAPLWLTFFIISTIAATLAITWWFPANHYLFTNFYGNGFNLNDPTLILPALAYLLFFGWLMPSYFNTAIPGGWSIQMEAINYALFPILNRINFTTIFLTATAVQTSYTIYYLIDYPQNKETYLTQVSQGQTPSIEILYLITTSIYWFITGMYLAHYTNTNQLNTRPKLTPETLAFGTLTLATITTTWLSHPAWYPSTQIQTTILIILVALTATWITTNTHKPKTILTNLGKYSYGIYFVHFIILAPTTYYASLLAQPYINTNLPLVWLTYTTMLLTSITACYYISKLLYETIEKPWIVKAHKQNQPADKTIHDR